jgi:hypothetical protein
MTLLFLEQQDRDFWRPLRDHNAAFAGLEEAAFHRRRQGPAARRIGHQGKRR